MAHIGKFAVIENEGQWKQYQEKLKTELVTDRKLTTDGLEFQHNPKKYPCLAATTLAKPEVVYHGELNHLQAICCFVYTEDAEALLSSPKLLQNALEMADMTEELVQHRKLEKSPINAANPATVLLLTILLELKSIGAIKQARLLKVMQKVENWLAVSRNDFDAVGDVSCITKLLEEDLD